MPRFNIFKALVGRTGNNQSKATDRSLPDQSSNIRAPDAPSLPSKKLTKRRPLGRQQSQPSYNVLSEDIGYHELGRYPKNLSEPAHTESSPPKYADAHPPIEETRLDYPTMTHDSFHPIGQSSKRWSPVPDVYREAATAEYDGNGTLEPKGSLHESLHMQEPPQHVRSQDTRRPRSRKRMEAVDDDDMISRDTMGRTYRHGTRGDIPINVYPEDTHDVHYLQNSTMRSEIPGQSLSMKWPVDFAGGEYIMNNDPYSREEGNSNFVEPVIFEHEVLRNDGEPNPKIWHYIVPGGVDVIFKDEDGNELTRIRNVGDKSAEPRITPMVIEDELGNVIYRTGDLDSLSSSSGSEPGGLYEPRYQKQPGILASEPVIRTPLWIQRRSGSPARRVYTSYLSPEAEKVILIDEHGRQIPIADRRKRRSTRQSKRPKNEKGR